MGCGSHVLLGLLVRGPMHGYDLKAAFEAELGSLWTLNYGQLYPALENLKSEAWSTSEAAPLRGYGLFFCFRVLRLEIVPVHPQKLEGNGKLDANSICR